MLVMLDETEGILLGKPTDGRCRMKCLDKITNTLTIVQLKLEVTTQMSKMSGTNSTRSTLLKV